MLYFLVPFRAKATCNNWDVAIDCFKNMYDSVLLQTDESFQLIVVCHDVPPNIDANHPHVTIIKVDIPVPQNLDQQMQDKGAKKKIGIDYIKNKDKNAYIMLLDADDIVCKYLAAFVKNQNGREFGWYFATGYTYSYATGKVMPIQPIFGRKRFDHLSGSTTIVQLNPDTMDIILGNHSDIQKRCEQAGVPLKKLPFRGAIYVVDTGNNHSIQRKQQKGEMKRTWKRRTYLFLMSILGLFITVKVENFPVLKNRGK